MAQTDFNYAANNSPRGGSSKEVASLVWCLIVVAVVALMTWFAMV